MSGDRDQTTGHQEHNAMTDEFAVGQVWHPRDSATRVKIVRVLAETVLVRRMDKAGREVVLKIETLRRSYRLVR